MVLLFFTCLSDSTEFLWLMVDKIKTRLDLLVKLVLFFNVLHKRFLFIINYLMGPDQLLLCSSSSPVLSRSWIRTSLKLPSVLRGLLNRRGRLRGGSDPSWDLWVWGAQCWGPGGSGWGFDRSWGPASGGCRGGGSWSQRMRIWDSSPRRVFQRPSRQPPLCFGGSALLLSSCSGGEHLGCQRSRLGGPVWML